MGADTIVLVEILSLVGVCAAAAGIKAWFEVYRELRWRKTLKKEELLKLEDELKQCMDKIGPVSPDASIEDIIRSRGYTIQEKPILLFQQAYTAQRPKQDVYIWKYLPHDRRHFTLAHELMHIIYHPDELDMGRRSRNRHFFFRTRDPKEQERDYMAASVIMPREKFWDDLTEADYFNLSPKARREFVYRAAQKYNVETSTVFRRISELKIMME